jgi:hypothetical protein
MSVDRQIQRARRQWKLLRKKKHWAKASYLKKFIATHARLLREVAR